MILNLNNKFVNSKKRGLDIFSIFAMVGILMFVFIPTETFAVEASDFAFSINSVDVTDNTMTVNVLIDAPNASKSKNSRITCFCNIDETRLEHPLNAIKDSSSLELGTVAYGIVDPYYETLVFGSSKVAKSYAGGEQEFTLKFDVSNFTIKDGTVFSMTANTENNGFFAYWNSAGVYTENPILASYTIKEGDISGDASTTIPTSSITDSTKGAATVTGTVDNGTATLNVASDKACVVACTTDDGATYNRVSAVQADSGYNFDIPNYSENMKFVVAVKGDVNGDGDTDSADAAVASAYEVGNLTSLTSLQKLVADVNLDGTVDSADSAAAKAAEVGNLTLPW